MKPHVFRQVSATSGDRLGCMWYGTYSFRHPLRHSLISFRIGLGSDDLSSGLLSISTLSPTPVTPPAPLALDFVLRMYGCVFQKL
ncbi:hypothetical protein RchiOBHm_Chr2g0105781 [Rosa chinensis]|uniref:Uncharacterized protein n=1 Tax=Rosa chinensis TaxID=74649 RepID=A0A2P6RNI5_ROSCH|nr:hypothetical protein RchiOBHm_Chr2g0105781 [Rosa chinensis]